MIRTTAHHVAVRSAGICCIDHLVGSLNRLKRFDRPWSGFNRHRFLQCTVRVRPTISIHCIHWFSTNASKGNSSVSQLRNLVKPFLLKCHPDVHVSAEAKTINLAAIQNLNSYLDTLLSIESADKFVLAPKNIERIFEIDFVLLLEARPRMKKNERKALGLNPSRRKVELVLPPYKLCRDVADLSDRTSGTANYSGDNRSVYVRQRFVEHGRSELLKLMGIAGLTPTRSSTLESESDINNLKWDEILRDSLMEEDNMTHGAASQSRPPRSSGGFRRAHHAFSQRSPPMTRPQSAYEKSRAQFTAKIQWHNYETLLAQAVAEMHADSAVEGLVERHSARRRAMIAGILANVRLLPPASDTEQEDATTNPRGPPISFVEQLVAFRRLSLLLDENFATLQMEEFGAMWETCRIVLTPSRPFNVSASALYKRQQRIEPHARTSDGSSNGTTAGAASMTGFSFTLHSNTTVTIHIPIDFRDDELIRELDRNVWDFYNLLGDGTESLFPDSVELGSQMA